LNEMRVYSNKMRTGGKRQAGRAFRTKKAWQHWYSSR